MNPCNSNFKNDHVIPFHNGLYHMRETKPMQ